MSADILDLARKYLATYLEGKKYHNEVTHPWRVDWEFVILHSLQVESYVLKILKRQEETLSEDETLVLRLAAILHDIGRLDEQDDHARLGAEIACAWLESQPAEARGGIDIDRMGELIATHSEKSSPEQDFSKAVLKDADILDEIGVLSVMMTTNWIDRQSPFFFYQLRKRLLEFELPYCDQQYARLNTPGGRTILKGKKTFIQELLTQLDRELEVEVGAENLIRILRRMRQANED